MRWWPQASGGGIFQLTMNVHQVQLLSGVAANFLRQALIGREHVQKVPQCYGARIGFWEGTTLVTWTANVQAWTISHLLPGCTTMACWWGWITTRCLRCRGVCPAARSHDAFQPSRGPGGSGAVLHLHRVFEQSRPWAKNWEKYFEVGWDKPQDDIPKEILDIFK